MSVENIDEKTQMNDLIVTSVGVPSDLADQLGDISDEIGEPFAFTYRQIARIAIRRRWTSDTLALDHSRDDSAERKILRLALTKSQVEEIAKLRGEYAIGRYFKAASIKFLKLHKEGDTSLWHLRYA
jgi:hypothetical protein